MLCDFLEKVRRLDGKRVCQLHDVDQADVTLSALDPTDVVPVQVRALRKFLLRKPALLS